MGLSVVIPVFNKWDLTWACLESLAKTSVGHDLEVVVVDNASTDETPQACPRVGEKLFGNRFVFARQETNRNFAPACNIGARLATKNLLFFLNNDTILTENWLPPLLGRLSAPPFPDVVGPLLLYPEFAGRKDRVQHLGLAFEPQFYPAHLYEAFPADHRVCARPRRFQAMTGAALLMSRERFLEAGLFDEDFINGGEDVEFGLRLTAQGKVLVSEPRSRIYHLASQTPGIHAHAEHNARVLKEKALNRIVPDLHLLAKEDGYELALTPGLGVYLDLPERRKALLVKQADSLQTPEELEELLLQEPLCHYAYEKLARLQAAAGQPDRAAFTLMLALKLRKNDPDIAGKLAAAAREAAAAPLLRYGRQVIDWYRKKDFAEIHEAAEYMARFTFELGLPSLHALYTRWLAEKECMRAWFGCA